LDAPLKSTGRTLFLVDADNVSVDVIREALQLKIEAHGAIHVRRCYCSAEFALKNLEFLKEHSMRAMVNATAGKNCTDIALAIDAVQLCASSVPALVVIVASDSDFAPLVVHLRELGCRVEGVGQQGKTGADSPRPYDDFIELASGRRRPARSPGPAPAPRPAAAKSAAPAPAPAAAKAASRRSPPSPEIAAVLDAVPNLASGEPVELRFAAAGLRKAGLLAPNASSTRLFKRFADSFVLAPAAQPNSVRYRSSGR
jgi:uncharacterized LabA/DUF88 family protein